MRATKLIHLTYTVVFACALAVEFGYAQPQWTLLDDGSGEGKPGVRTGHGAVWDSAAGRMLVFGGWGWLMVQQSDLWSWSPSTGWELVDAGGGRGKPGSLAAISTVWDSTNGQLLVFGGERGYTNYDDLWAWSSSKGWSQLDDGQGNGSPEARRFHSAVWDNTNDRMLVYGGYSTNNLADLWSWSSSTGWTLLDDGTGLGKPTARSGHSAVWDNTNGRMLVFGGDAGSPVYGLTDLWSWSPSRGWTLIDDGTGLGKPFPKYLHSAVWDSANRKLLIFGGADPEDYRQREDLWAWSESAGWILEYDGLGTGEPGARRNHTAVWDNTNGRMLVFGGGVGDFGTFMNDLWSNNGLIPTPIPTPLGAGSDIRVSLYTPHRDLAVDLRVFNTDPATLTVNLFVAVEVAGGYYFYPAFTADPLPLAGPFELPTSDTGFFELWRMYLGEPLAADVPVTWYSALIDANSGGLLGSLGTSTIVLR